MWEIGSRVAAGMVGRVSKGDVDAMFTWCPIKWVGDGYEWSQERNAAGAKKKVRRMGMMEIYEKWLTRKGEWVVRPL